MADHDSSSQTEGPQQGQKAGHRTGPDLAGSKKDTSAGYGTGSGSKMKPSLVHDGPEGDSPDSDPGLPHRVKR